MPEDFDAYAAQYENMVRASLGSLGGDLDYFRRRKSAVTKSLCPAPPRRVLDYGCGTGGNLSHLCQSFPEAALAGCDVSEKSLERAGQIAPGVSLFLLGRDPIPPMTFDLVFVSGVFHHVPPAGRPALMAAMAAALAPGGTLLVFEHNPANPITRRIVSRCEFDAGVILVRPVELEALAKQFGLRGPQRRYISFVPPALAPLACIEPWLGWLPLGAQYVVTAQKGLSHCQRPEPTL